jgi:putative effector of murein hydrolase
MAQVLPRGWFDAYVVTGDLIRNDPQMVQSLVMALVEANRLNYQNLSAITKLGAVDWGPALGFRAHAMGTTRCHSPSRMARAADAESLRA